MEATIIVESFFGNTGMLAQELCGALQESGAVTRLLPAGEVTGAQRCDLLVLGSPTHARGLPTPQTREQAAAQGGQASSGGIRELIEAGLLPAADRVAIFETVAGGGLLYGSAAKELSRLLQGKGITVVERESFRVRGHKGPLADGAIARARQWGRELAGV